MPAPWERGPWEAKSRRCGVCDGTGTDTDVVGAGVTGAESGQYGVCDDAGIMGVGAMGGRIRSSFRKKLFKKKIFLDKKYFRKE